MEKATKEVDCDDEDDNAVIFQLSDSHWRMYYDIIGDSCRICAFRKRHEKRDELIMRHEVSQWTILQSSGRLRHYK